MKRLLLLLCFGILCSVAGYSPAYYTLPIEIKPPIRPYEALWEATVLIESSGNPNALNRLESACGIAQIRPIRLKDFNQRTGNSYSLRQMYDPNISKQIWMYYATTFHPYQAEQIAKSWNGTGKSNIVYWGKVKKQMELMAEK